MINKQFRDRLNSELDEIGLPLRLDERVEAFSKLIKEPKYRAEAILSGNRIPEDKVLNTLSNELEVSVKWLLGKTNDKHKH